MHEVSRRSAFQTSFDMKNVEFSSKNGVFDINSFICECDTAVSGEPVQQQAEPTPAPEPTVAAVQVPVADGTDPIIYHPLEEVLCDLRMGKLILMTDDPHRENGAAKETPSLWSGKTYVAPFTQRLLNVRRIVGNYSS